MDNLIYCVRCKTKTGTDNITEDIAKNGRHMERGTCVKCGASKVKFISKSSKKPSKIKRGGESLVDKFINNSPVELHLMKSLLPPKRYNFCGSSTKLHRFDKNPDGTYSPNAESQPVNGLDSECFKHDVAYFDTDNEKRLAADKILLDGAEKFQPGGIMDRINKKIVTTAMKYLIKKRSGGGVNDDMNNVAGI